MNEQEYLSPRQLLSYLCDLESKIPRLNNKPYIPIISNNFTTNQDLINEAKQMLKYVGLVDCQPICEFNKTENGVAGFTKNTKSHYEITITVSEKYRNNTNACLAVLAHEICHKVIFIYDINFTPPIPQYYNEVFVDLCTIYIGFGELILNGYINTEDTLVMGYLPRDMYYQTFAIVSKTMNLYNPTHQNINDPFLEEAISIWHSPNIAKNKLKDFFMENEKEIAQLNRDIMILQQILDQVYVKVGNKFRKLSYEAEKIGIFNSHFNENRILSAFRSIYEYILTDNYKDEVVSRTQEEISSLILTLSNEYELDFGALNYENVRCPNCQNKSKTNINNRDTIIKCTTCGLYFRLTNSHINITVLRKHRSKVIEERNKYLNSLKKREEELNNKIKEISERENQISNELKEAFRKGANISSNEANKAYIEAINKIPKWIRILFKNKIPSKLL